MAREHVYPVCGTGSKTISFKDLEVDILEEVNSSNSVFYVNKDRSISLQKNMVVGGTYENKINRVIVQRGQFNDENQVLIDLNDSDLPDGFLESIGAEQINGYNYRFITGYVVYMLSRDNSYGVTGAEPYIQPLAAPGTVMCVGAKNFNPAQNNDYITEYPQNWGAGVPWPGEEGKPYVKHLFHDEPPSTYFDGVELKTVQLNRGEWFTVMFTGTRWVLLGSNNWY
jgi:hypothetical protein